MGVMPCGDLLPVRVRLVLQNALYSYAEVVELVDTLGSGPSVSDGSEGSSPFFGTSLFF